MPPPQVAILSPGAMGAGLAAYLTAHSIPVLTTLSGRSAASAARARAAGMQLLPSDAALLAAADILLAVVPPRDALATAHRVAAALPDGKPLHYLELNAVSPSTSRAAAAVLAPLASVRFTDGGIIGDPPSRGEDGGWRVPNVPVSGPWARSLPAELMALEPPLFRVYGGEVWGEVGTASALKCCFASFTKGFAALGVQSYATAARAGVLRELRGHLGEYAPQLGQISERGVVGARGKAWRWVREMEEIAEGDREVGGWEGEAGGGLFDQIAGIYGVLGEVQGREGENFEEIVDAVVEVLKNRKLKRGENVDGENV